MQKGTLMKRVSHSSVMLLFFFLAISQVYASPITLPAGLNPGDQYRLAFVTSEPTVATSSVIGDYNEHVRTNALRVPELAALNTDWFAIASTGGHDPEIALNGDPYYNMDARDNTGTNPEVATGVPIYNLAGQLIAEDNQDLWDGILFWPIEYTEDGTSSSAEFVWTGTMPDGLRSFAPLGTRDPTLGDPHVLDPMWINVTIQPYYFPNALYGISDTLTAPVPLPSAILLFGSGLVGLIGFRRKFKK